MDGVDVPAEGGARIVLTAQADYLGRAVGKPHSFKMSPGAIHHDYADHPLREVNEFWDGFEENHGFRPGREIGFRQTRDVFPLSRWTVTAPHGHVGVVFRSEMHDPAEGEIEEAVMLLCRRWGGRYRVYPYDAHARGAGTPWRWPFVLACAGEVCEKADM
ncbi:hypothetical protein HNR23_002273 [Nocardiopsis mwathae]|uniref:Uncharacterized protein n=2 Tax=Nocardiopsis mwathae TaxID=1472723 RepID=A0A7W9YHI0_9ACTN|nr:hypothetical protein [Nocardiopsis mwathae]